MDKGLNAVEVLANIEKCIAELETAKVDWTNRDSNRIAYTQRFRINVVCDELSIFDWWNSTLSLSQLKQMRAFVKTAIKMGYKGYVCFRVGAVGCSHGMWAHTDESTDGYSPDSDVLFHSFRCDENYWDVKRGDEWCSHSIPKQWDKVSLSDVKTFLKSA